MLKGLSESHAHTIVQARESGGCFRSWEDFARRTRLSRAVLVRLAEADALASVGLDRRSGLWHALAEDKQVRQLPLLDSLNSAEEPPVELPRMAIQEQVKADYQTAGLSLRAHPLWFQRARLDGLNILPASRLATLTDGRPVRVAGLVLVRQRPSTARGITFVTLEDETGTVNLIVRQDVWQRFYRVARTAAALVAHGRLQRKDEVIHVLVTRLEDMTERLGLRCQSRDFH
jgi:error-prone DNA polymerase